MDVLLVVGLSEDDQGDTVQKEDPGGDDLEEDLLEVDL